MEKIRGKEQRAGSIEQNKNEEKWSIGMMEYWITDWLITN